MLRSGGWSLNGSGFHRVFYPLPMTICIQLFHFPKVPILIYEYSHIFIRKYLPVKTSQNHPRQKSGQGLGSRIRTWKGGLEFNVGLCWNFNSVCLATFFPLRQWSNGYCIKIFKCLIEHCNCLHGTKKCHLTSF